MNINDVMIVPRSDSSRARAFLANAKRDSKMGEMLSSDILTQFRDRGDEIRVNPLSFAEIYECYDGDKRGAWREYFTYGGMPLVWTLASHEEKLLRLVNEILLDFHGLHGYCLVCKIRTPNSVSCTRCW